MSVLGDLKGISKGSQVRLRGFQRVRGDLRGTRGIPGDVRSAFRGVKGFQGIPGGIRALQAISGGSRELRSVPRHLKAFRGSQRVSIVSSGSAEHFKRLSGVPGGLRGVLEVSEGIWRAKDRFKGFKERFRATQVLQVVPGGLFTGFQRRSSGSQGWFRGFQGVSGGTWGASSAN